MEKRKEDRQKKRITCELQIGGRCHRGIVLDLSPRGLFVQTDASPTPGAEARLRLRHPDGREVEVGAVVARKRLVPRHLASVASGGVGLEVKNAPEAFFQLFGGKPEASAAPAPEQRFRVRVKQTSGPRSRTLVVTAASETDARRVALADLGEDWTILDIEQAA